MQTNNLNIGLEKELNALKKAYESLRQENKRLERQIQEQKTQELLINGKLEECLRQLQDKQTLLQNLEQQLSIVQSNLEHYRESVVQQRTEEKLAHERELSQLHQELLYFKKVHNKQAEINRDFGSRIELLEKERRTLEVAIEKSQADLELQKNKTHNQEKINKGLENKITQLQADYESTLRHLKESKNLEQQHTFEIKVFLEKLKMMEAAKNKAEVKVNELQNERLFILQEKTELKSQLKQFNEVLKNQSKAYNS